MALLHTDFLVKGQIMSIFVPSIALLQFVSPILCKPDSSTYHTEVENFYTSITNLY